MFVVGVDIFKWVPFMSAIQTRLTLIKSDQLILIDLVAWSPRVMRVVNKAGSVMKK